MYTTIVNSLRMVNWSLNKEEIAVVYYRSGYGPHQYASEDAWEARKTLEVSKAIKWPHIDLQLLTFKKIQEALSDSAIWDELFGSEFSSIQFLFKNQMFALDNPESTDTQEIIEQAINNPDDFVLKTQREGGGNNYFGEDIPKILSGKDNLSQYSLMRRIRPIEYESILLKSSRVYVSKCVAEIGVYGVLFVKHRVDDKDNHNEILTNQDVGFLMKTKGSSTNEGGVCAGYSCIECMYFK